MKIFLILVVECLIVLVKKSFWEAFELHKQYKEIFSW